MVLSRREIQAAVDRGEIVFEPPLEKTQWGEASVDLSLGFSFTRLNPNRGIKISVAQGLAGLPARGLWTTVQKKRADRLGKPETFTLDPKEFVLPMTHEKVTVPPNLIALVEGRSTYARVGLSASDSALDPTGLAKQRDRVGDAEYGSLADRIDATGRPPLSAQFSDP
jgi:dCTP deaminase